MSEQEVLEQLSNYGDWLSGVIDEKTEPTEIYLLDPTGNEVASPKANQVSQPESISSRFSRPVLVAAALLLVVGTATILAVQARTGDDVEVTGTLTDSEQTDSEQTVSEQTVSASDGFRQDLVLPGEEVLQQTPLIVAASPAPEPNFDTSELGQELVWEPTIELTEETRALIDRPVVPLTWPEDLVDERKEQYKDRYLVKATVLGELLGEQRVVLVTDGPDVEGISDDPSETNWREIVLVSPRGGNPTGTSVPPESRIFIDSEELGPDVSVLSTYASPTGWVELASLPVGTAAVSFADSDQQLWMRPRAGIATFPGQFDSGEQATLTAYSSDGEVLHTESFVVEGGFDPSEIEFNNGMAGTTISDVDSGETIVIGDNDKPTILVMGNAWCQPCQEIEQAIPLLKQLESSVNIYGADHYNDPLYGYPNQSTESWPTFEDWSFPKVDLTDHPAGFIGSVPVVVVLDEQGNDLGVLTGFDDLEVELAKLGITAN